MSGFSRSAGTPLPQFVPGKDHELQPIGSADEQVAEAMRVAKEMNSRPEMSKAERIARMDGMLVNTALDFLDNLSPHELQLYLQAEKESKARSTVLGRYGW